MLLFASDRRLLNKMSNGTDFELLQEYARSGSEEAFRSLVERYLNLVYSVAMSRLANEAMAKDITQIVFAVLARKAGRLSERVILPGWLFQVATHACQDLKRAEARRKKWEDQAVQEQIIQSESKEPLKNDEIAPVISGAMSLLAPAERDAILLRFFEEQEFRQVGERLGVSEAAAKMRVARGLEKLRHLLQKQGVTVSNAALTGVLPQMLQPAPAGLAGIVKTGLALNTSLSPSNAALLKGVLKAMAWTKAKTAIVGAIVVASLVTPLVLQQQAQAHLRGQEEVSRRQAGERVRLVKEHERLEQLIATSALSQNQSNDLQRLRAEIGPLQQQSNEVVKLRQENRRLQDSLQTPRSPIQIKEEMMARADYSHYLIVSLFEYAGKNQGQFPTTIDQAAAFLPDQAKEQTKLTSDHYEIVYQGSLKTLTNPAEVIVIREKEPWQTGATPDPKGKWMKYYGYADGSVRLHQEMENKFDHYEKSHMVVSGNP